MSSQTTTHKRKHEHVDEARAWQRRRIMSFQVKDEPVCNAKVTPGFAQPSSYVIHTVGPQLRRRQTLTTVQHHQLQSCYTSLLDLLLKTTGPNTPVSIAFPRISTDLSAAADLDYTSEEAMEKFHEPMVRQGLRTMYHMVGRMDFPMEFLWGYYFKQIHVARFTWTQHRTAPTYALLKAIRERFESKLTGSTFIATTNADGMFGQEGFSLESVHTMQGDYGSIQCKTPCSKDSVFDIEPFLKVGLEYTNPEIYYIEDPRGIPQCPKCGGEMSLFLRLGHWFLESWFDDKKKVYRQWLSNVMEQVRTSDKKLVILEIGVRFRIMHWSSSWSSSSKTSPLWSSGGTGSGCHDSPLDPALVVLTSTDCNPLENCSATARGEPVATLSSRCFFRCRLRFPVETSVLEHPDTLRGYAAPPR